MRRFEALTGYIVVVSLFIFIQKLKDRHWKEHLFVVPMTGVIEIVGLIAAVIDLVGRFRGLITQLYKGAKKSFWETSGFSEFVRYLEIVEHILWPYMDPAWQEVVAMTKIVQAVRDELHVAWDLVRNLRDTRGWRRTWKADKYAEAIGNSQAKIEKYVHLIPAVEKAKRTAQDAHDLDRAFALSLSFFGGERREANGREERSQDSLVEEIARLRDEEDDMTRAILASLAEEVPRLSVEEDDMATAIRASLAEY